MVLGVRSSSDSEASRQSSCCSPRCSYTTFLLKIPILTQTALAGSQTINVARARHGGNARKQKRKEKRRDKKRQATIGERERRNEGRESGASKQASRQAATGARGRGTGREDGGGERLEGGRDGAARNWMVSGTAKTGKRPCERG
jgi:hypothetical protein